MGSICAPLLSSVTICVGVTQPSEYLTYIDPTAKPGLRRTVAGPDGGLLQVQLLDGASAVRVFSVDDEGAVVGVLGDDVADLVDLDPFNARVV